MLPDKDYILIKQSNPYRKKNKNKLMSAFR